jgi:predicted nuclease of predicted toxin-antitoxin system
MRFLADVCCPKQVEDLLVSQGHDVLLARAVAHDAEDVDLLALAARERRIVLTRDKDYGDLTVAAEKPAHGIVLFRLPGSDGSYHAERMAELIRTDGHRLSKCIVVVRPRRDSVRPLLNAIP